MKSRRAALYNELLGNMQDVEDVVDELGDRLTGKEERLVRLVKTLRSTWGRMQEVNGDMLFYVRDDVATRRRELDYQKSMTDDVTDALFKAKYANE